MNIVNKTTTSKHLENIDALTLLLNNNEELQHLFE